MKNQAKKNRPRFSVPADMSEEQIVGIGNEQKLLAAFPHTVAYWNCRCKHFTTSKIRFVNGSRIVGARLTRREIAPASASALRARR